MKALLIPVAILLVLFLLGQIRIGGRAQYSEKGAFVWFFVGGAKIQIYPAKPKTEKKPKQKKTLKSSETEKAGTMERVGGALEYALELLPILLEAAGQCWQKLRVDRLELELTAAAGDPADAALLYGQANAILGAFWYPLTEAFEVKDGTARVNLDFERQTPALYADAALSFTLGQLVWLGIYFGLKVLRSFLAVRKQQKTKRQQRKAV